jgi:hypothetical protein
VICRATASLAALSISAAANAQPCHPEPRLHDSDPVAYEAQARRVFAAHGIPYEDHRLYELDHRVPRCIAVGDYDADSNLSPQPLAEAKIKDSLEREVCRRACDDHTLSLGDAIILFTD